ncbi:MAG: hypothetical protein ABH832_01605 [bacterium]
MIKAFKIMIVVVLFACFFNIFSPSNTVAKNVGENCTNDSECNSVPNLICDSINKICNTKCKSNSECTSGKCDTTSGQCEATGCKHGYDAKEKKCTCASNEDCSVNEECKFATNLCEKIIPGTAPPATSGGSTITGLCCVGTMVGGTTKTTIGCKTAWTHTNCSTYDKSGSEVYTKVSKDCTALLECPYIESLEKCGTKTCAIGQRCIKDECFKLVGNCNTDKECSAMGSNLSKSLCDLPNKKCYLAGDALSAYEGAPTLLGTKLTLDLQQPKLSIRIPGLTLTDLKNTLDSEGYIHIPWIGQYITALYKFSMVAVSIVAVLMILMQGIVILTGQGWITKGEGDQKQTTQGAYKKIGQIFIGLVIAWGSYALLYNINPDLVEFKALKIKFIAEAEMPDFEGVSGITYDYKSNAIYEKLANEIADKFGFNGCLFAVQLGKESGWNPTARTGCCYGLGQVSLSNAKGILNTASQREQLINKHSKKCPECPALGASDQDIGNWLLNDAEGNLIVAAIIRTWAKKTANPISAASAYGMGSGSYNLYLKVKRCVPEKFNEEELLSKLKSGVSVDYLIKASCIPPNAWALPTTKHDFGGGCPGGSYLCCQTTVGGCIVPNPRPEGRIGVCFDGTRKGLRCAAVAGAESYIRSYIKGISRCAK